MKKTLMLCLLLSTINARADENVFVKVSKYQKNQLAGYNSHMVNNENRLDPVYGNREYLKIVVLKDTLKLNKVSVNRGNCEANLGVLPKILKFGDTLEVPIDCNPIEMTIETDSGEQTLSWDE